MIIEEVKNQSIFSMWIPIEKPKIRKYVCPRGYNIITEMSLEAIILGVLDMFFRGRK